LVFSTICRLLSHCLFFSRFLSRARLLLRVLVLMLLLLLLLLVVVKMA